MWVGSRGAPKTVVSMRQGVVRGAGNLLPQVPRDIALDKTWAVTGNLGRNFGHG